ncbi:SusD/RagB-like outer membrane lipoprotein [Flavobacterium sp. 90]|uniref:RagB/SusD family nutrient uptake outer membrane protein n=1 Tax=unclassified Flavobacterium TaxID=196869 RepID=UPI000EB3A89F|nr:MULTISPECIES: RagB/SusD family nutrient uptake outer membrane protein [unclassified Flavobacterium]RKR11941.1 SusD/RagB-like outer membrane lipoprotein [Flavobacterium sp. 81]TCK55715.1 SusD/RagB-like outer membrane lipoprotein [Flavobacterium sp. 90]
MKNKLLIFGSVLALALGSCTNNFEDINTNETGFSNHELEQDFNQVKAPIKTMQRGMYILVADDWQGDIQFNLNADIFSGYMGTPHDFEGNRNNSTYVLLDGWNGAEWVQKYQREMVNAYNLEKLTKGKFPQFYAWSLILKVYAMHKTTDYYGPIVYSGFGNADGTTPYDSQKAVYDQFFAELKTAIDILNAKIVEDPSIAPEKVTFFPDPKDPTDGTTAKGKMLNWIKFANSLRLRLAMRISNIDPVKAKAEAEAAVSGFGVITTNNENMAYLAEHPVKTYTGPWADINAGGAITSIMNGYNDPRRETFFHTAKGGVYQGIRMGSIVDAEYRTAQADLFSKVGPIVENDMIPWFNASESHFLKAEAALKGWNVGGSAQSFYESGITTSFAQLGAGSASAYINDDTSMPANFTDPLNPTNNIAAQNLVSVKWSDAASNEVKLQKIITQKWIAIFPDGQEAWAETRRTGYPKLFLPANNFSGGKIPDGTFVRRVNFYVNEKTGNPAGYAQGVSLLGGPDTGATRLWWDTGVNKF